MNPITQKEVSRTIVEFMPNIIRGIHLGFLSNRTVTQTQFLVIISIHSSGKCSMNTLADSMHVSMPTISGVVDRLVKSGYILRVEDSSDRRLVLVELSAKGKNLVEQFQKAAGTRWEEILKSLSPKELESMQHLFQKLNNQIKQRIPNE